MPLDRELAFDLMAIEAPLAHEIQRLVSHPEDRVALWRRIQQYANAVTEMRHERGDFEKNVTQLRRG
jgi:hypothetical protein